MLRLAGDGTSAREIAQRLGIARSTVQDNLKRAAAAGLNWPLPGDLTDDALENRLFARAGVKQGVRRLPEPNWAGLALELKKPGVTLMLLWEEYRAVHSRATAAADLLLVGRGQCGDCRSARSDQ
jgi:transposase